MRTKAYFEFRWEFFNQLMAVIMDVIFLSTFWYIVLSKKFLNIDVSHGFLFLFYYQIAFAFWVVSRGFLKRFKEAVISGEYSSYLLYPSKGFLVFFIKSSHYPLGPILRSIIFFTIAILSGLRINFNIFLGFLTSIISGLLIFTLNIFIAMLYFYTKSESPGVYEFYLRKLSFFPTHVFKGISFIVLNVIFPAFSYGTYSLLVSMGILWDLVFYYTIYSLLLIFSFLSLSILLYRKSLRRWEAYGI